MKYIKYFIFLFIILFSFNSYCNDIWIPASDGTLYCFNEKEDKFYTGWQFLLNKEDNKTHLYLFNTDGVCLGDFTPNGNNIKEKACNLAIRLYNSGLCNYSQNSYQRLKPMTFDCSSFVGRIYKLCGLNFFDSANTTYQQIRYFLKSDDYHLIDYEDAKEGDLVYYGETLDTINHCGIIIRNENNKLRVISCSKNSDGLISNLLIRKDIYAIFRPVINNEREF